VVDQRWQSLLAAEDSDTLDENTRNHIANDMGREYTRAHRKAVAALDSERYLELLDSLDELLAHPPLETAAPESEQDSESSLVDAALEHRVPLAPSCRKAP